jgi:hypothetical protein
MITSDRGPQFTSNLWFKLCEMLHISHRQTTAYHPESNGVVERLHRRLKDALRARAAAATWSEELPLVLLRLRAQPREDTGLSPAEAVFGAPIVLPNEFCKMKKCQLMQLLKIFQKPCMFLLFLCLGTILAPCYQTSCQATSSQPPSSGPTGRRHPTPSAALRWPLHRPVPRTPLLHHPSRVPGRGHRRQPPQGLYGRGRHAWQPASLWQTAGFTPRWSYRNQAGLVFRPAGFSTFPSGTATRRSRNHFSTRRGSFCTPGTGGTFTGATDAVLVPSMGTAKEVRPLTSSPSSRGQSSGGALWTHAYIPSRRSD